MRAKKEFEFQEYQKYLFGTNDIGSPTQDATSVVAFDIGPRFASWPNAVKNLIYQSSAFLQGSALSTRVEQLGQLGVTGYPWTDDALGPVAIRSHYEVYEICNMTKFPMVVYMECYKWRPGYDYPGLNLSNFVLRSLGSGNGLFLWNINQYPPGGNATWKGVAVPNTQEPTSGFGPESLFPHRIPDGNKVYVRKIWKKKVLIPASGSFQWKVRIPRIYPVYFATANALEYLCKSKIDRCMYLRWHSVCGQVPTTTVTSDPGPADYMTEKMLLPIRCLRHLTAVRYAKEPAIQVRLDRSTNYTSAVPPRSATSRPSKFQAHTDAEAVGGNPGQAST